jgi:hypothetical protein
MTTDTIFSGALLPSYYVSQTEKAHKNFFLINGMARKKLLDEQDIVSSSRKVL